MPAIFQRSILYAQNFLTSSCLVDALLDRCSFESSDILYEIGPGKGIITDRLVSRCSQVVAIEKDAHLVEALRCRFDGIPNIIIYEGDFLQFRLPNTRYKVFASIPFNITTAIVTKLTTAPCPPDDAYLVVQKEAADKFLGKPRESLYAVLMKPWFELDVVHRFRRSDFVPTPRVDVVMLRLRKRGPPLIHGSERQLFRDFVVYGFTARQPCLASTFKDIFTPQQFKHLGRKLGFGLDATPTALRFEQWLELFDYFKRMSNAQALQVVSGSEKRLRRQQATLEKMHKTRVERSP
jgi:23S rRNA (adenine-N6)-dimethyltransferase